MFRFSVSLVLVLFTPMMAHGLTVAGTITDSSGTPVSEINVEVRNDNFPFPSTLIETVFTNAGGMYSTAAATAGQDPFLRVRWEFQLTPTAFYNNRLIKLIDEGTGDPWTATNTFGPDDGPTTSNITGNVTINSTLTDSAPLGLPTLLLRIQQALDFYRNNRGTVAWTPNYDVSVHIRSDSIPPSYASGGEITLKANTFNGTGGTDAPYELYHEMGHLVHYRFAGNSLPPSNCLLHTVNSENNTGCALVEGWPSYVAVLTGTAVGVPNDPFYGLYKDTGNTNWRGCKFTPAMTCPVDSGFDNSGEIVEGAVAGVMFDYAAASSFADNFRVMHNDDPNNFFEFRAGLITNTGGAGTPPTLSVYRFMQRHGIFYSRLKLDTAFFDQGDPPDSGNPPKGNFKIVDGKAFIRGKVDVNYDPLSDTELHVAKSVSIDRARVGWKTAANGSSENLDPATVNTTFTFTPPKDRGLFTLDEIELDTTTLGGDKDYDLIVQGENGDQFRDNFDPDWTGDTNAKVSSDERYLKRIGAWFDVDRDATTKTDDEGKVIVDNTPPIVDSASFKPQ